MDYTSIYNALMLQFNYIKTWMLSSWYLITGNYILSIFFAIFIVNRVAKLAKSLTIQNNS